MGDELGYFELGVNKTGVVVSTSNLLKKDPSWEKNEEEKINRVGV